MAEGGQITVGAVAVEIVPSAKNFASALAAQILPQTAGIAEEMGKKFGDKIQKKTQEGISNGLSGSDSEAEAAGEKAAKNFGGAFGRQAKAALKAAEAALPEIEVDAKTGPFDRKLAEIREKAKKLADVTVGVDMNAEKFMAEYKALQTEINLLKRQSPITIDARVNLAQSTAALATLEEKLASANVSSGAFAKSLNTSLKSALENLPDPRVDLEMTGDENVLGQISVIRGALEGLRDQRIGIDVSATDAMARITEIKAKLEALSASVTDPRLSVDIKAALANVSTVLAATEAAKQQIEEPVQLNLATGAFATAAATAIGGALASLGGDIDLKLVGDKKAVASIEEIRTALTGLQDEQIGITISPRDALAQIAIVKGALEALAASVKDPALAVNIAAALKNLAVLTAAAEAAKAKIEEPVELKLREGAFTDDLRSALAGGAGKIIQIPVGADVSPAEKELGLIGKQMDRLSAKKFGPKFDDEDLLAAAERVQKRLEKLTDAATFGRAVSYQAREALKGIKSFTDGVRAADFKPKIDFEEIEVKAGTAANKVERAFSEAFAGLPDPDITARDNAPEVQKHYEPVYRLLQDMSNTKIGLDTPTPAAVKNLRDASDALKSIRGLGKISPELDASLPAFHKAVDDAEHELGTLLGHHPPVEVDADTKPAVKSLGFLETQIASVVGEMQKALGSGLHADVLRGMPEAVRRDVDAMVKEVARFSHQNIGDLGAPNALIKIDALANGFRGLLKSEDIGEAGKTNILKLLQPIEGLYKEYDKLHGLDITPELRAQELQKNAGSMVQGLAAQFGKLENTFPKVRLDADVTPATKQIDAVRDAARDLKLNVGVTIPVAEAIARAELLHKELAKIFKSRVTQEVKVEAAAGMRETESILKSLGVETQAASRGLLGLFNGFSQMTPAAKLANLAAVGFLGALTIGIPIAAAGIIGLAGLFITLGAAIGAAAIGAGVFALAFAKVSAAIKAKEAAQKAAASNAAQDAQTELANQIALKNADDAITSAKETLGKANTTASRNARDNALAVTAAQKNLTQANAKETAARKKLSDAYKSAKADLAKLTAEIKANQVAQQSAIVSITQAREKYNALLADPTASESDIEAAQAAYNTQESGLKTLKAAQQANAVEKAKYDKDGLNGNDDVIAAQASLKEAVDQVADSQLAVTAASTRAREQQVDDANAINDAETALGKARTDRFNLLKQQRLAAAATAATRKQTTKDYDDAPPAVKQFADYYEKNIKPAFTQFGASAASSGILKSIEGFFEKMKPLLPDINSLITTVGKSVGGFIDDLGSVFSGPEGKKFIDFLKKEVPIGFKLFGDAAKVAGPFVMNLIEKLGPVAEKIGPILIGMLKSLADKFAGFADKKNGGLSDLIDKMVDYAPMVIKFLGDLFSALGTIVEALAPVGKIAAGALDTVFKLITALGPGGLETVGGIVATIVTVRKLKSGFDDLKAKVDTAKDGLAALRNSSKLEKIASGAKTAGGAIADLTGKVVAGTVAVAKNTAAWVANTAKSIASGIKSAASAVAELTGKVIAGTIEVAKNAAAWVINTAKLLITKAAMLAVRAATALWAAAQWILDAALNANPITLIVIAIVAAVALIAFGIYELYKHWDQVWGWIKKIVSEAWKHIRDAFKSGADWVTDKWHSFTDWISDKWHSFTSGISDKWHSMWDGVKDGARSALDWIKKKFESGVELIGKAWSVLKGYLALPIHGFFTIVNDGLIDGIDKLLKHFPGNLKIDHVPEPAFIKNAVAGAAKTLGLAKGGVIPGYEPGRDTVPAVLSKGEAVLVPQVTRQIGPAQIEEWNRRGLAGMPIQYLATGTGSVALKPHVTVAGHPTVVVAKAEAEPAKPTGLAGRLLKTFTDALKAPAQKLLGTYGDTPLVQGLARVPELFVDKIGSWVSDKVKALGDKIVNAGSSVLHWLGLGSDKDTKDELGTQARKKGLKATHQVAADYAQTRLPKFGWDGGQMGSLASLWDGASAWKWNATDPGSGAYGIPQARPGKKMADAGKDWKTNAYTQVDWGLAYIAATYGDPATALIQWQNSKPHLYDQGGYLPPGLTLAMNATGKNEYIFTDDQLKAMRDQRTSQVGVVVRVEDGAVPGLVNAEVDRSFNRLADASIYGGI